MPVAAPPRVAVIILTWNGRDDTLRCLESLRPEMGPGDAAIVVDNGSSDGTVEAVRGAHAWAEVIEARENLGFAAGNNLGLRAALERGFAWALLLNNDTVVAPGLLDALVAFAAARPALGAAQPLLVREGARDAVDSTGAVVFALPAAEDGLAGAPLDRAPTAPEEIFGPCAAAALYRVEALRATGLLDERLFILFEDVDLAFRLRAAGFESWLVPAARVFHRRGISGAAPERPSPRRRFWLSRNRVAVALRYWPLRLLVLGAPLVLAHAARALLLGRRLGERALPLWRASLAERGAARRALRERGADRFFRWRRPR